VKNDPKPALYLFLRIEETSSMGEAVLAVSVSPCTRSKDDEPHGLSYGDRLDNVTISERVYAAHPTWTALGELRMIGLGDCTLRDAEGAVRAAKDVQRKLDALTKQAGPPATFGAACLRFANAIRAQGMIRRSPRDPQEWQTLGLEHIAAVIDHAVAGFREKHAPTRTAQESAA
jgi:hypothetical protein